MTESVGTLYLCASPIGNLEDITLRVLRVLEEVHLIACEDTRHSIKLLRHFHIQKPLMSFHDHSPESAIQRVTDTLAAGKDVALLTDAGMPGISDPGYLLVQACRQKNLPYTVLPGASAALTALVLSGFPGERFLFEGFLPRKGKDREERLTHLDCETATVLIYESPHRLESTLEEFSRRWPTRPLAAVREITKKFEEVITGTAREIHAHHTTTPPRGEYVLVLGPVSPRDPEDILREALSIALESMAEGAGLNQAAKAAAAATGLGKRDIYQKLLKEQGKNRQQE